MLLSRITELVTLRVPVSTVITSKIDGDTGSASCVMVVHGEVELGVDVEQARFENVDPEARTATLLLPQPTAHAARLDFDRTRVYSVDRHGLWWLTVSDEPGRRVVNRGLQEAQAYVEQAARDGPLIRQAQARAEGALQNAFDRIDWTLTLKPAE